MTGDLNLFSMRQIVEKGPVSWPSGKSLDSWISRLTGLEVDVSAKGFLERTVISGRLITDGHL
jgi:hypothetical protein